MPAPRRKKRHPATPDVLFLIERAAVLDPHVPRADALLGVGQGSAKKFCPPPEAKKRHPAAPDVLFL